MKLAVDSSAFAKRYVHEIGSDQLYQILQNASDLALCVIAVPEIISGLNRRKREGFLSSENYNLAKKHLLTDVRDTTILQITPSVVLHSIKLLEANTLRTMDAFHIACALEWKTDLKDGQWKQYFPDGTVKLEGTYVNDEKQGEFNYYYPDGRLNIAGHYEQSYKTGEWIYLNENSKVIKKEIYENGKLIKEENFDKE
jgi:predicted nucleic acid-binding protein